MTDPEGYVAQLCESLGKAVAASNDLLIATDGSAVHMVSAWAVVFEQATFAQGVVGEDQTPHRAELEALRAVLWALAQIQGHTCRIVVACECQAALMVAGGAGDLSLFRTEFQAYQAAIRAHGLHVVLHWVPSHGRVRPHWRPPEGFTEDQLRAANDRADGAAKQAARRRAASSRRAATQQLWQDAKQWELQAIRLAASAEERYFFADDDA